MTHFEKLSFVAEVTFKKILEHDANNQQIFSDELEKMLSYYLSCVKKFYILFISNFKLTQGQL